MFEYKKSQELFDELSHTGDYDYIAPLSVSKWERLGHVLSHLTDLPSDLFKMVYSFLEGWNHHAENSILTYIFPQYFTDEKYCYREYIESQLLEKSLSREIPITDYKDREWKVVGKAKVKVIVEYEEFE